MFKKILDADYERFGFEQKPVLKIDKVKKEYKEILENIIKENGLEDNFKRFKKAWNEVCWKYNYLFIFASNRNNR